MSEQRSGFAVTLLAIAGCTTGAQAATPVPAGDQAFASYAFASELGSGIYEFNGRSLQIYRIPLAVEQEGWRVTLPVTVGLVDFRSSDVIDLRLPRSIGSISLVPGLEHEFPLTPDWTLTQFLRAGYTKASGQAADAVVASLGLRSDLRHGPTLFHAELQYAVADLRGPLPGDAFLRLRDAFQVDIPTATLLGEHRLRVSPYVLVDNYAQPPRSPVSGQDVQRSQAELGLSLTLDPRPRRLGIPLPALGISYRIAGELSGWRLAIGAPF